MYTLYILTHTRSSQLIIIMDSKRTLYIRVGKESIVKNEDIDVIKANCRAFGIRSNKGRCDKLIRITKGKKVIAKCYNWNGIISLMEEWELNEMKMK